MVNMTFGIDGFGWEMQSEIKYQFLVGSAVVTTNYLLKWLWCFSYDMSPTQLGIRLAC